MRASRLETDVLIKQTAWTPAAAEIGFWDDLITCGTRGNVKIANHSL